MVKISGAVEITADRKCAMRGGDVPAGVAMTRGKCTQMPERRPWLFVPPRAPANKIPVVEQQTATRSAAASSTMRKHNHT